MKCSALVTLLLLMPTALGGPKAITLAVTPSFQYPPGSVRYTITIPPHPDNSWYCWGWESLDSITPERQSCEQLEGLDSPKVRWKFYDNIPEGHYTGMVMLFRSSAKSFTEGATTPFEVLTTPR